MKYLWTEDTGDKKVMTLIMSDAVQHILKNIS